MAEQKEPFGVNECVEQMEVYAYRVSKTKTPEVR